MKTIKGNDYGEKYLVEDCKKIRIDEVVKKSKKQILESILHGFIELDGVSLGVTSHTLHHGGRRLFFECIICKLPCGIIYKHPVTSQIGCRQCLQLDYRSRRYKGMIENNLEKR